MKLPHIITIVLSLSACLLPACSNVDDSSVNLIFETDMGNDVDDAIALDMIFKYAAQGKANLLGVSLNKGGLCPLEFVDVMNTWYKHPEIPIGKITGAPQKNADATTYARVAEMKDTLGNPVFERSISDYDALPEAVSLYRKILSSMPDKSVTIASVGFSTNLARLLASGPDEYSKLDGMKLVKKKVRLLVTMAGCFDTPGRSEYNVKIDVPAAKEVFEKWPTPVVTSPFELGLQVCYPASSIENDFNDFAFHPVVEAYKDYMEMPYDRPCWDPTAVIYAVEGGSRFTVSESGSIEVGESAITVFKADPEGDRYYLSVTEQQAEALRNHIVELLTARL